jgi:hypothetical protein
MDHGCKVKSKSNAIVISCCHYFEMLKSKKNIYFEMHITVQLI